MNTACRNGRFDTRCGAYATQLPGVIIDNEWLGEVPIVAGLLDGCVVLGSGTV